MTLDGRVTPTCEQGLSALASELHFRPATFSVDDPSETP